MKLIRVVNLILLILSSQIIFNKVKSKDINKVYFECDVNSVDQIADGLVLKLNKKNHVSISRLKSLANLESIESNLSLDYSYSSLKSNSNKRLKKLNKYKKAIHDHGIDRSYIVRDFGETHKYTCSELKKLEEAILSSLSESEIEYLEPNYIRDLFPPIELNQEISRTFSSSGTNSIGSWGLGKINAKSAWAFSTGKGVRVAMLDSGIDYNHPNLWEKVWIDETVVQDQNSDGDISLDDADTNQNGYIDNNFSFSEMKPLSEDSIFGEYYKDSLHENPYDGFGHGSHVAGIIAAESKSNNNLNGLAYDSKLLAMKIFDNQGNFSSVSELLKAIRSSIIDGAQVINASIGGSFYSHLEEETYQLADELGVLVVAAAGNNGSNNDYRPIYPANYASVFSVASTDENDQISLFSNYGNTIDVAAPGNLISSTMANDSFLANNLASSLDRDIDGNYGYWYLSGTSMATPYVSALAALLLAKYPDLSTKNLKEIISKSSQAINGERQISGGRINALSALNLASTYSLNSSGELNIEDLARELFLSRPKSRNIIRYQRLNTSSSSTVQKYINQTNDMETITKVIRALNSVDTNRNGLVSSNELKKYKKKFKNKRRFYFKRLDVNRDGKVNEIDDTYIKYIYSLVNISV